MSPQLGNRVFKRYRQAFKPKVVSLSELCTFTIGGIRVMSKLVFVHLKDVAGSNNHVLLKGGVDFDSLDSLADH